MTFEQEIKAIDELAASFRSREQVNIMLTDEVSQLKQDNAKLTTALEYKTEELDKTLKLLIDNDARLCTEIRSNGELKATLKQLLAEQMALASRAAEMLRSLEEKPEPIIGKEPEKKATFASDMKDAQKKDREERLLETHISKTLFDISQVPEGEEFILDAPYGESISDWILKKWYRRIIGKAPMNYAKAPSIKLRKDSGGGWTYLSQAPKLSNSVGVPATEGREPLPFRPEETKLDGDASTETAFEVNGGSIPNFLKQGPAYHDDQGRQS